MEERTYRQTMGSDLSHHFILAYKASDLWVGIGGVHNVLLLEKALAVRQRDMYEALEAYIDRKPIFLQSLNPLPVDAQAPVFIQDMYRAGRIAGTGPMASVAGLFAQKMAEYAIELGASNVVIENGGDLYLHGNEDLTVSVFAGKSSFTNRIALSIAKEEMPLAVCTSSGTVGHSFSFGKADALVVKGKEGAVVDALATIICNQVDAQNDVTALLERYIERPEIDGILAIRGDELVVVGQMKLKKI